MKNPPLVSCIMPTYNRRRFVPHAIRYFLRQDYPQRELLIVDDGTDAVKDLVPEDPRIRYLHFDRKRTIGAKRNLACQEAQGEIIVHWDDDDWTAPWRLRYQVENLLQEQADICGLARVLFCDPLSEQAWQYIYPTGGRPWVYGGTLCYTKAFWQSNPFPDINVGEDARFVWSNCVKRLVALQDLTFYIAIVHAGNVSPKRTTDSRWSPYSIADIHNLMGDDRALYAELFQERQRESHLRHKASDVRSHDQRQTDASVVSHSVSTPSHNKDGDVAAPVNSSMTPADPSQAAERPLALVTAASGIGDILRITPLIRVLARLGYDVDVLLAPDYPEVVTLLQGAPEIRQLFHLSSSQLQAQPQPVEELSLRLYDIATFTVWSSPLQHLIRARRTLAFERARWLQEGDSACVDRIARAVGWQGSLPPPFAVPSERQFGLRPRTIALHPGCKPDWPWKKWHGFDALARLLPDVAIIGTDTDLHNGQTYFHEPFQWPKHAQDFVGKLSLPDTAALLRECAALVSNDSGMMQLGVALGIPTFGIFGITSPQREAIPADHMYAVTKGLSCEPACRQMPWGRHDCEYHLQCLKSLTAQEVFDKIRTIVPVNCQQTASSSLEHKSMDNIGVVYYGYVFDASGYGHAARAYIHALHHAGISLSVVDLANHARQVPDELVESLVGRRISPDFYLFHGIPPQWARLAFRLPNAIGITVWETDTMPSQWRNILNHVLDVWLPSEFNVSVFHRALEKRPFRIPHPIFHSLSDGKVSDVETFLEVTEHDFVFYSIFEWQDRKSPLELLTAYLQAFPTACKTVLILKTNPGAVQVAHQALETARQQVHSQARVVMRCEAWSAAEIEALHARGDCYVSLHRGEGWGYPLFEAASRGTPVIATDYAGPLDYLQPPEHHLVRCELGEVRQPYMYYHPHMRWAEPDVAHAVELMRWLYSHRDEAKEQAAKAAERLQRIYSLETIGEMAGDRLMQLLKHTQPQKWQRLVKSERGHRLRPPLPIPGTWFDEDYFERGLKSNWHQGYNWSLFAGVFRETAAFLGSVFSEAQSYLDIGCAKGFLVQALRESGKECWGFDHSPWAIDHAEENVKPFITLESVDDVSFDRQFDLLLAFDVFQQLTESQIVSFLSRAHSWTRIGLVAVIPSFEDKEEERGHNDRIGDLAHITRHTRHWWHDVFLRSGWCQDPLHRIVERICRTHVLPTKMGWNIYVYAPGQ